MFLGHITLFLAHPIFSYFSNPLFLSVCGSWEVKWTLGGFMIKVVNQCPYLFIFYLHSLSLRNVDPIILNICMYLLNPLCVANLSRLPGYSYHVALIHNLWAAIIGHLLPILIVSLHVNPMPVFITKPVLCLLEEKR